MPAVAIPLTSCLWLNHENHFNRQKKGIQCMDTLEATRLPCLSGWPATPVSQPVMKIEDETTHIENTLEALGLKIIRKKTELMKLCTTADTPGKCDWQTWRHRSSQYSLIWYGKDRFVRTSGQMDQIHGQTPYMDARYVGQQRPCSRRSCENEQGKKQWLYLERSRAEWSTPSGN